MTDVSEPTDVIFIWPEGNSPWGGNLVFPLYDTYIGQAMENSKRSSLGLDISKFSVLRSSLEERRVGFNFESRDQEKEQHLH